MDWLKLLFWCCFPKYRGNSHNCRGRRMINSSKLRFPREYFMYPDRTPSVAPKSTRSAPWLFMGVMGKSVGCGLAVALLGAAVPVLGLAEGAIAQASASGQLQKSIDEGRRLYREGSRASLTQAIQQFEQALELSRAENQKVQQALTLLGLGRVYDAPAISTTPTSSPAAGNPSPKPKSTHSATMALATSTSWYSPPATPLSAPVPRASTPIDSNYQASVTIS